MIQTGFDSRVKVQQIIESQLPSFMLEENPNVSEFLKQYYISQEFQGGPIDLADNLDQYLRIDNLTPEVVVDSTILSQDITFDETTISVSSTKGFPNTYGLLKIDNEIITYTGITSNSFTGCIRGFSGITNYHQQLNSEELIFEESTSASHSSGASIQNLSSLFLKEFYKKLKYTFAPGFEDLPFSDKINASNFIRNAKSFYESKGTNQSIEILFKVLFGEIPKVINLEEYLVKPSSADYLRREVVIVESLENGTNPLLVKGQSIFKTTDINTNASVSSVEAFTREGRQFYKLELFIGNSDQSAVFGNFVITPNTKTLERVEQNSNIINVDSTVGFSESGTLFYDNNEITYTGKTVNQFLGCSGINVEIPEKSNLRSNDTYFSYENGDTSKKVLFRILGVISSSTEELNNSVASENDTIEVAYLGEKIKNNSLNYKEVFSNSWIYNTSTRHQIIVDQNTKKIKSPIDRSSLKVGDEIEFINRSSDSVINSENAYISSIDDVENTVIFGNAPQGIDNLEYDIRRVVNKSSASNDDLIDVGNSKIISDVLNVYSDDKNLYVASNSLPSEVKTGIDSNEYRINISENIKKFTISSESNLTDASQKTDGYFTTIKNSTTIPFVTGDEISYSSSGDNLVGLDTGNYFVELIPGTNKIKLFRSPFLIGSSNNLEFAAPSSFGTHDFILASQKNKLVSPQKLLKKFPLEKDIQNDGSQKTLPGSVGMLINGVEIHNYKSKDKVYYGPLSSVNVSNQGSGYDVINPPLISVSSDVGINAKIQPVISGQFENVYVDSQDYDIDKIVSIDISGGNGSGAVIEPVIAKRQRQILFDARNSTSGGGISSSTNQIRFLDDHNLADNEQIIYNSNGNPGILAGIGTTFADNSVYFVRVDNSSTISLFNTLSDKNSGINTVSIFSGTSGIHNFKTSSYKNTISFIKVLNGGSNYTNRKLIVKSSGISTINNTVNFKNHGFDNGDVISYNFETTSISGLSTTNQYCILKVDDDSFRLCDAGVGGTSFSDFNRENYVKFSSTGSGYQYFKYPDISVSIKYNKVGFGTTTEVVEDLVLTPVVKGSIVDSYLYESGTGYGSTILNYENNPTISIKNGRNAQVVPVVINGKIDSARINNSGLEYHSIPEIIVKDSSGSGTGAQLRAIVENNRISDIKIVSAGIGYSANSTTISVVSSGSGAIFSSKVRELTINENQFRFTNGEVLLNDDKGKLKYSVSSYFENLRTSFKETLNKKSDIIGWAYDGNPIYGPISGEDPENLSSDSKILSSGYTLDISNVIDRPSGYSDGFFVEDYKFDNSGDLDEYNGRFEKTKDFPNGVYAYHAVIDPNTKNPSFPYFIGNKYHSKTVSGNVLDQSFDFNNSKLRRNTFPYKVDEDGSSYEFFNSAEFAQIIEQQSTVESVNSGSIESVDISFPGSYYKVGDKLVFDNEGTSGFGLDIEVSSISGKTISTVTTSKETHLNSIFTWDSPNTIKVSVPSNHGLNNLDYVNISGFSTNLSKLNGNYKIFIPEYENGRCLSTVTSSGAATTEIYVSPIPQQISVGSSIGIGTETLSVLGIFENQNVIRVRREFSDISHAVGTAVTFLSDYFTFNKSINKFDSRINDKVFFNPTESVGVGTIVGVGTNVNFSFGDLNVNRDILSRSIHIDNHPFKTNQKVIYTQSGITPISISTDSSTTSNLLSGSELFVVNKGPSLIGLKTSVSSEELFFHTNGSDDDEFSLESNYNQILGDVDKIESTVSISTDHRLSKGDQVTLNIQPNLSVGIGTDSSVSLIYNQDIKKLLVNPIGFNSTGVNTTRNEITITSHGLKTGDKVYYEDSSNTDVNKKSYYVYAKNRNIINLCETRIDSQKNPPTVVSFASTGGQDQKLSLINPNIISIKNNNLVFDTSDSTLSGYNLKFYYDSEFKSEFVGTGSSTSFSVNSSSGITTINYSSDLPENLYYSIEKDGDILKPDTEVKNYSKINYRESSYNKSYSVYDVQADSFKVNLEENPEKSSYTSSECKALRYSTTSNSAIGPVDKLSIISSGSGYKKLPTLSSVTTDNGKGLSVNLKSNKIGTINKFKVINDRFEYSSDNTLRPEAKIPSNIRVKNSNTIKSITVTGGKNYIEPPELIIVNPNNNQIINSGILKPILTNSSLTGVEIVSEPKGLTENNVNVVAIRNTNGITVLRVDSSNSGIFTCTIQTPQTNGITSFTTQPFNIGDKVFIEGIQKYSSDGGGFNSSDYGYKLFEVSDYIKGASINDKVEINASDLTTNTGIALTVQDALGVIVPEDDYPVFEVSQKISTFLIGEKLNLNNKEIDLTIVESDGIILNTLGSYELKVGDIIVGQESGNIATVDEVVLNDGVYQVNYSNTKDIGWSNDIGKLNQDYQVIPDNDYYQNLSYSIQSSLSYSNQKSPVNNLVHVLGMKNFADTGITSSIIASSPLENGLLRDGLNSNQSTIIKNIQNEERVDTIYNFDLAKDIDVINSTSKYVKFNSVRLTDYSEINSNVSLTIDDISGLFSSGESENTEYLNILTVDGQKYNKYLIRVSNGDRSEIQLTELLIFGDSNNYFIAEKTSISNNSDNSTYGDFILVTDELDNTRLRFVPLDAFNNDYDLKIIRQTFVPARETTTQSIGNVDLFSNTVRAVGLGATNIFSIDSNTLNSVYASCFVRNINTEESNFVRLYISHDGTNTYIAEYNIDTSDGSSISNQIGNFSTELSDGNLILTFDNNSSHTVEINSELVNFSVGVGGTYRFILDGQIEGNERSAVYESKSYTTSSATPVSILSLNKNIFNASKSFVEVSIGASKALHEVLVAFDGSDVYSHQLPFMSVNDSTSGITTTNYSSGIGTFGGEISGSNLELKFYPDSDQTGNIDIVVFSKSLYNDLDTLNEPDPLQYGSISESIDEKFYNGINLIRINRKDFELRHDKILIFKKIFNPNSALSADTGKFNIKNHFFRENEELIYTPKSTFVGIASTALTYKNGSVEEYLPSTVFAKSVTNDSFYISTTRSGTAVTFTDLGSGNAHQFEMAVTNSKSLITLDGLVQYPLASTKITYTLENNIGGQLSTSSTLLSLSGITTIYPLDILKIEDEYVKVTNVGLGTTNVGPITNDGTINLVEVERGVLGSASTSHTDTTAIRVHKGAYNITDGKIFFTDAPRGNPQIEKTKENLDFETTDFGGRCFFRSDYRSNKIYDDISDEFTGIGRTFDLKVGGASTTGISTIAGNSGLVFVNNIFQSPTTENNSNNNFTIVQDTDLGISTITFSGLTKPQTDPLEYVSSISDVNMNEVPRGGIIVSYGSTSGLGFAPLVGASVTAVVSGGVIQNSIGIGTTDNVGSGYNGIVSIGISVFEEGHTGDTAEITATVGAGGTLTFNVSDGGTGYTNPQIFVSDPSYENLEVIGVSRIGIGETTDTGVGLLLSLDVAPGIGSTTFFGVSNFNITRTGYSFRKGDVFKPVGLVTDARLSDPISDFTITVVETYSDNFAAWEFGSMDYIDSLKNYQNGQRKVFPLYYDGELLSFEPADDVNVDMNACLIIFVNGVLQTPIKNYVFDGGTSFAFTEAPKSTDNIAVYFYKGDPGVDTNVVTNINETIKRGDEIRLYENTSIPNTITQDKRTVFDITFSDKLETNSYYSQGIDEINSKPLALIKQKVDKKVNGEFVYKSRDSIEGLILPTAKIIKDVSTTDDQIFVDNADLFNYENDRGYTTDDFEAFITLNNSPVSAGFTAVVSSGGTVSSVSTTNIGSGYTSSTIELKFSRPPEIGVGVGTTATATATITNGSVSSVSITNPGLGYSSLNPPKIICEFPQIQTELIKNFSGSGGVQGFSGIITGITTSSGVGVDLALTFRINSSSFTGLSADYPIYIFDTRVGNGVTSIYSSDSEVVSVGTTFVDNIYNISAFSIDSNDPNIGIITCNIKSDSSIVGVATTSTILNPVGNYSWGRLSNISEGLTRGSNPVSIGVSGYTVSGLSSFPTIQRRGVGIRTTGALPKRHTT